MKKKEMLVVHRAMTLLWKIDQNGGLCSGGEQSPNAAEVLDVAAELGALLPKKVRDNGHFGCVGIGCHPEVAQ